MIAVKQSHTPVAFRGTATPTHTRKVQIPYQFEAFDFVRNWTSATAPLSLHLARISKVLFRELAGQWQDLAGQIQELEERRWVSSS